MTFFLANSPSFRRTHFSMALGLRSTSMVTASSTRRRGSGHGSGCYFMSLHFWIAKSMVNLTHWVIFCRSTTDLERWRPYLDQNLSTWDSQPEISQFFTIFQYAPWFFTTISGTTIVTMEGTVPHRTVARDTACTAWTSKPSVARKRRRRLGPLCTEFAARIYDWVAISGLWYVYTYICCVCACVYIYIHLYIHMYFTLFLHM